MKTSIRFSLRFLLLIVLLVGLAVALVRIYRRTAALESEQKEFVRWRRSVESKDTMFRTLRALNVDSDDERAAIRLFLAHWDELEYRGEKSLWPWIDGRRFHVAVFHTVANSAGNCPSVSIAVALDGETAIDAVTHVSDGETETHSIHATVNDDGVYVLTINRKSPGSPDLPAVLSNWTVISDGFTSSTRSTSEIMARRVSELMSDAGRRPPKAQGEGPKRRRGERDSRKAEKSVKPNLTQTRLHSRPFLRLLPHGPTSSTLPVLRAWRSVYVAD